MAKKIVVAFRYCAFCQKPIELTYYPFNYHANYQDDIEQELDMLERLHQKHLCLSCKYEFATCKADNIAFGDCIGNDNVLQCDNYNQLNKAKELTNDTTRD